MFGRIPNLLSDFKMIGAVNGITKQNKKKKKKKKKLRMQEKSQKNESESKNENQENKNSDEKWINGKLLWELMSRKGEGQKK